MSSWSDLKNNLRLRKIYEQRIEIVKSIREFFWSRGFVETETPIAVRYASQEPYLNPLPITIHDTISASHPMYLRTSPEYALKKLLAAGFGKIFELAKCFRDYESFGGNHNTEFTMLEWYRAPASRSTAQPFGSVAPISSAGKPGVELSEIMADTEELFKFVGKRLGVKILRFKDCKIDILETWDRMSMTEAWQKYAGLNLDNNLTIEQLNDSAHLKGYATDKNDGYEDIFFKIFLNEIEPKLGLTRPVFIYDYPAQMSSLSRLSTHDPRYAERFELYVGGLEIANAFGELTDAVEQKTRLEKDRLLREKLGKEVWPVDEDFIACLRSGLPSAGGIALGVDRMVVLFTGAKDINEVIFQSVSDQLGK